MKTAKRIFTVISVSIIEPESADVTTCSFVKFGDAVDYIMRELGRDDESIRDVLAEEHFYSNEEIKWYVIETLLKSGCDVLPGLRCC